MVRESPFARRSRWRLQARQVAQVTWNPPAATPPAPPGLWTAAPHPPSLSADGALPPGARAELERDVREELRRELEDDVRAEVAAEVRRDEEDRLRQEFEIQVRRQLLAELTPGFGSSNVMPMGGTAQVVLPQMASVAERAPQPVRVTSEQSPEALEVFRDEAQEHLQSITTGLAQLERNPGDTRGLQSVPPRDAHVEGRRRHDGVHPDPTDRPRLRRPARSMVDDQRPSPPRCSACSWTPPRRSICSSPARPPCRRTAGPARALVDDTLRALRRGRSRRGG